MVGPFTMITTTTRSHGLIAHLRCLRFAKTATFGRGLVRTQERDRSPPLSLSWGSDWLRQIIRVWVGDLPHLYVSWRYDWPRRWNLRCAKNEKLTQFQIWLLKKRKSSMSKKDFIWLPLITMQPLPSSEWLTCKWLFSQILCFYVIMNVQKCRTTYKIV